MTNLPSGPIQVRRDVAAHCTPRSDDRKRAPRVLFVHGGALGDLILTLRLVNAARTRGMPHVSLLGRGPASALARFLPVERVFHIETDGFHALFGAEPIPHASPVRASLADFGLVINMMSDDDTACARHLREVTGGVVRALDPRPADGSTAHITDQWLDRLGWLDGTSVPGPPQIHVSAGERLAARAAIGDRAGGSPIAMIHPGSGGRAKCWPLERFLALSGRLREARWTVWGLLGPAELETWAAGEIAALASECPLLRSTDVGELPAWMAAVDLYVGNDAGGTHLSAAVGTPTIAIFGPTDPRVWRPLGGHIHVAATPDDHPWPTVDAVQALCMTATGHP